MNVADLLKKPMRGNLFAPDAYVQGDFESGLMETRTGSRLMALPALLLESIYEALEEETGQAGSLVLYNCGRWWGKNFYRRFASEVTEYYGQPLAEMEMIVFVQCLKECWKTYGNGVIDLDFSRYDNGFIVVKIWRSPFAYAAPPSKAPVCFAEAGILSAFFSQLTDKDLGCVQTSCESQGSDCNRFIIGLSERLKSVSAHLEEGHDHDTIIERLCSNQRE